MLAGADEDAILLDVTRDFTQQARALDHVDLVLLTHVHRDATGGLPQLERWLRNRRAPATLVAHPSTVRRIRERYRCLDHLVLTTISSGETIAWRQWRITPVVVPHAPDCTTLAWRLEHGHRSIVYASDVARLTPALAALCADCDLLVIDGAMWRRPMYSHLEIQAAVPILARWPVHRALFTQVGRSTPDHDDLERWLRATEPRFGAAYDGLTIDLGGDQA